MTKIRFAKARRNSLREVPRRNSLREVPRRKSLREVLHLRAVRARDAQVADLRDVRIDRHWVL